MSEHICRIVYDPTVAARPYGPYCETCAKLIGACQTQADAEDVAQNHQRWQSAKEEFARRGNGD